MQAGLAGRHRVKQTKQRGTQALSERHIHMYSFDTGTDLLSSANTVMAQRCRPYVVGNLVAAKSGVAAQHIVAGTESKTGRCENMSQGTMHISSPCS